MEEENMEIFDKPAIPEKQSNFVSVLGLFLLVVVVFIFLVDKIGFFLILALPVLFIFLPIILIILLIRYKRKGGQTSFIDKLTFFILLFSLIAFFMYAMNSAK
ncbi:MAG: hypothetical protein WCI36_05440 [bacterium]